jgi:hypothetical protein
MSGTATVEVRAHEGAECGGSEHRKIDVSKAQQHRLAHPLQAKVTHLLGGFSHT